MVLLEITKIFEKRRLELYNLLEQRRDEIKPEIQHQVYGAINEIDIFLKTLEYYKEKDADKEIRAAILVTPQEKENTLSKMMVKINERISKLKIKKDNK